MGHVLQDKCWENTLVDITFGLIMTMEIEKGIDKGKEAIIGI